MHSLGPWKCEQDKNDSSRYYVKNIHNQLIATVTHSNPSTAKANATLLACSWELLYSAKALLHDVCGAPEMKQRFDNSLRDIILKTDI